jgi:hypothetical protein
MRFYSEAEMERTMKVQEVILKAMAGSLKMVGGGRDYRGSTIPAERPAPL